VSTASAVAALFVDELERDTLGVAIPRPEVHLVVRFGPSTRAGLDVHALGGRQRVHRKLLRSGQRIAAARLQLGATEAVLGVPASLVAGRIVPLEDLWGDAASRRLCERLAAARDTSAAGAVLESAIAERLASGDARPAHNRIVQAAVARLTSASVNAVAVELGVSERHLLRVFREAIGMGPKTFAKLMRFRHAVRAAREATHPSWANIAAGAGYYDQAHLISEFRAISGVTPGALLGELRAAQAFG
jgi:AraC-like DNA-binding protein